MIEIRIEKSIAYAAVESLLYFLWVFVSEREWGDFTKSEFGGFVDNNPRRVNKLILATRWEMMLTRGSIN